MMKNSILLFSLMTLLGGCAAKPIYYWGNYQDLLYTQYNEPGKATPEYQIEKMEADIQKAKSKHMPLPPGFWAHLGFQYLQVGNVAGAKVGFETEKKHFPESAKLMNRLTRKMN
jgi:hypothetical protein